LILGYLIVPADNGAYMLRGPSTPVRCEGCSFAVNHRWIDPHFELRRETFDISTTYDGYVIASARFCEMVSSKGAECIPLQLAPQFSVLFAREVIAFDAVRRRTRFLDKCPLCGHYRAVAGATPVYLVDDVPVPNRLVRSDVEFGSGDERHPLLLVGTELGDELASASLAGLALEPIST